MIDGLLGMGVGLPPGGAQSWAGDDLGQIGEPSPDMQGQRPAAKRGIRRQVAGHIQFAEAYCPDPRTQR